jgi:hypothetical protein
MTDCQFCRMKKIKRPRPTPTPSSSVWVPGSTSEEHFVSKHCELGDGLSRLIEEPMPEV